MSALDDFIAKLGSDADFASVIKACKSHEAVMSAAKGAGISLTEADVTRALARQMSDLSDEELDKRNDRVEFRMCMLSSGCA